VDLNFQAARVAQELLAWDKARARGLLGEPAADDAGRIIEQGRTTIDGCCSRCTGRSRRARWKKARSGSGAPKTSGGDAGT